MFIKNDEEKYKIDFVYLDKEYKGFSFTDPKFKIEGIKFSKAVILVSLPDLPYSRHGGEHFYKFVCALYPIKKLHKLFGCYKI